MREIHQRFLATLIVAAIIAALGILAQRYASLDWVVARELRLREMVQTHGIASWVIGFLVYTCLSMIPGTAGKSVICGWLYGFWAAVLMVDGALTVAALATFLASRYLFRDAIESRFGVHLVRFRRRLESQAGFYLLTLRLFHTPFSLLSYLSGAVDLVPIRTFWWTTQLGVLPGTMIFVFAGTRIPTLSALAERGPWALLDTSLIAALAVTSALPLILKAGAAALQRCLAGQSENPDAANCALQSGETDVHRGS